jgi:hypothetical protein
MATSLPGLLPTQGLNRPLDLLGRPNRIFPDLFTAPDTTISMARPERVWSHAIPGARGWARTGSVGQDISKATRDTERTT